MKLSAFITAALLPLCSANFDLYFEYYSLGDGEGEAWKVFQTDPTVCKNIFDTAPFLKSNDVSGRKTGIRCVGWCQKEDRPGGVEVLEMHFTNNPLYHWTIYKNRNYEMIGLDGKVYGRCIPFPGYTYECFDTVGYRKFRCLTSFTAAQINGGRG